jgi:hypothetical protein
MIEKHRDLTDNKLVLVSGSGFTPTALQKAELEGVEALTLGESKTVDWTEVVGKIAQVYITLPQVRATNVGISPCLEASLIDLGMELFTAVFKDSQVAYGSLQVEDLQGLLTIVEAPGRPMSADLRLSPSTKKKR